MSGALPGTQFFYVCVLIGCPLSELARRLLLRDWQFIAEDGHSSSRCEAGQSASASRFRSMTDYRLKQQGKRTTDKQECCYSCLEQDSDPIFRNVRVVFKY